MDISKCLDYTIQLLKNITTNSASGFEIQEEELEGLWHFSQMHNISNLLYLPLKKCLIPKDSKPFLLFEESYYKNIVFATQQHQYLEQIIERFEAEGIKHMKMKGSVLKHLYPDFTLRTSCDVDVYIGDADAAQAKRIMLGLGFDVGLYDDKHSIPDTYHIGERFYVELHRKLMQECTEFKGSAVCSDIEKNLKKNAQEQYGYKMTDEDFYVFMIIHIAKHIKAGGIGIRAFFDVWLYLKEFSETLDWEEIEKKMAEADLGAFNKNVLLLIDVWSGKIKEVPPHICDFQNYIANSGGMGTLGEKESEILYDRGRVKGKLSYYLSIIFLPFVYMKEKYKILKKIPILLPFCWAHRGVCTLLFKRMSIHKMLHHFDEADVDNGRKTTDLKKRLGL